MSTENDSVQRREKLISLLRERDALHDERVAASFRAVPREIFLPGVELDMVYSDEAIVTKTQDGVGISSSSQPAIMAIMLEQLAVHPGMRVLEIGAGTGYNAALLRELVGPTGHVTTIDIDDEVVGWARARLDVAGYADIDVRTADGADGWSTGAPYDRIELTVGAADISPAWVDQLVEGGILVLPLLIRSAQAVVAFAKRGDSLVSLSVQPGGFMPMRGQMAGRMYQHEVMPGLTVSTTDLAIDLASIRSLLAIPPEREPWPGSLWGGFHFYAGLFGLQLLALQSDRADLPFRRFAAGVVDTNPAPGLALIAEREPGQAPDLLSFGGRSAAESLRRGYKQWEIIGKPAVNQLRIVAVPKSASLVPPGEWLVDSQWWRFGIALT